MTASGLNDIYILNFRLDYLLHVLLYLPLAFLLDQAEIYSFKFTVIIVLLLAVMMELVQFVLPYRTFNVNDLLANIVGGVFSVLILLLIKKITKL